MTAADSQITDELSDFDELETLRAAHGLPPFGEDQDDRDPIVAKTIRAEWGTARIKRYLRRLMRNPGEYAVSFTGRITPQRVDKFIAVVNDNCGVWEGGAGVEWEDDYAGVPRPTIFLNSLHHGPYPSEEGELPWGGLYADFESLTVPTVPSGTPPFTISAGLHTRQGPAD